jgi:hypothetical protein
MARTLWLVMSTLGQRQTSACRLPMSALSPKADIDPSASDVRFVPKADILHCSRNWRYSITSSAMESKPDGTSMPSARAVCKLMTNSNLVDCSTGRSAGLAPLRMLPV